MKIMLVLTILVFLLPIYARGADWQMVTENRESKIYIDKKSLSHKSKNLVKAWFKIVLNTPVKIFENYMTDQIVYEEHNCKKGGFRILQVTGHYSNGTSEEVISDPSEWIDISSHTNFWIKHEYLCKGTMFHRHMPNI